MGTLSSNGFSVDQQVLDVLNWIEVEYPEAFESLAENFPNIAGHLIMDGSQFDLERMGIEGEEWSSWLIEAIEATELVIWEEGEPFEVL